ncbi:MAG: hypothetical protein DHS20C06_11240 [Hyphobacterium sp.]|nr:MAG: hypothetical protein DHS20C06_11240 [Hyphobacterium sp.]
MAKTRYRKRLLKDLDRWIETGLVDAVNRESILADVSDGSKGWPASGALAILGSVLLALAALSFVAANWANMGALVRLAVLFGTLWACFLSSSLAFSYSNPVIGHAFGILGAAIFGVSIVLVAQIFNISSWRYTVLGISAAGALGTALLTPSRPALILGCTLGTVWVGAQMYNVNAPGIVWAYLPLWGISLIAANRMKSMVSVNLLGIGLFLWVSFLIWDYSRNDHLGLLQAFCTFILAAGGLAMAFAELRDRQWYGFGALTHWGSTAALTAGFALQFSLSEFESHAERIAGTERDTTDLWLRVAGESSAEYWMPGLLFAGLFLAGIIWRSILRRESRAIVFPAALAGMLAFLLPLATQALGAQFILLLRIFVGACILVLAVTLILYGAREDRRFTGGLGIALFVAQALYIYSATFGDLLDTSLFFLVGGFLLFGLSVVVIRLQKRITMKSEVGP